ncbi:MAG: DsrE family protein [Candidatus Heimdallarchaeota archaeon]|nr:MAG: DsrE family protein [Candidatus Heimdallarchaeota archaeon]
MSKLVIVCDSGATEKLQTAALVASGAITSDYEVFIFFMHDAVYALKKDAPPEPDVASVFPEVSDKINQARQEGKLIHWKELLEDLKDLGDLRITACVQITEILGLEKEDLLPFVDDVAGVNTLAEEAMKADQVITI